MRSDTRQGVGRFWLKITAFLLANAVGIVLAVAVANAAGQRNTYSIGQTESVTRFLPYETHFDVLIAGPSHALEFAWGGNQQVTERNLGVSVMNIGYDAAGPMVESIYYDLFRARGNTADTIVLIAHPFVLFSRKFNEGNRFTGREPIRRDLLDLLLKEKLSIEELFFYFQSKLAIDYWRDAPLPRATKQCTPDDPERETPCKVDPATQAKTNRNLYPDGVDLAAFEKYMAEFDALVRRMHDDGSRVIIVVPPVMLGAIDGLDIAMDRYQALADTLPGVEVYDLHDLYDDPSLFQRDLSHLNVTGVERFTREVLRPLVHGEVAPTTQPPPTSGEAEPTSSSAP